MQHSPGRTWDYRQALRFCHFFARRYLTRFIQSANSFDAFSVARSCLDYFDALLRSYKSLRAKSDELNLIGIVNIDDDIEAFKKDCESNSLAHTSSIVTNMKYAAKMAKCTASLTNNARLAVLADAYPAPSAKTTSGATERCVDWRAALDGAGPLHALLAQEKAAGAAVGSTVGLVPAAEETGAGTTGTADTGAGGAATAGRTLNSQPNHHPIAPKGEYVAQGPSLRFMPVTRPLSNCVTSSNIALVCLHYNHSWIS